ncbi:MAG: hemerythrin domain-containing protein [Gammaproteobacteria bacterium]|nr:hemerythrin domain-containing protein [Gammaproteobacteria bacterium]
MARLDWNTAYVTGLAALDYEHGLLLDTVNATCARVRAAACDDEIADSLADLYERVCAHLALEESLMREARDPWYAVHRADHERLADTMRDIMDAFDEGVCGHCDKRLDECLVIWFDQHFRSIDGGVRSDRLTFEQVLRLR